MGSGASKGSRKALTDSDASTASPTAPPTAPPTTTTAPTSNGGVSPAAPAEDARDRKIRELEKTLSQASLALQELALGAAPSAHTSGGPPAVPRPSSGHPPARPAPAAAIQEAEEEADGDEDGRGESNANGSTANRSRSGSPAATDPSADPTTRRDSGPDVFEDFAKAVFDRADADQDGLLSAQEFDKVIQSPSLNLEIAPEEVDALRQMAGGVEDGGRMSLSAFLPVLREILTRAFVGGSATTGGEELEDIAAADPEWVQIGYSSEEVDALPLFFNRFSGKLTYTVPPEYQISAVHGNAEEQFELEMFVRRSDGMVLNTYVPEGSDQRLYLDWELDEQEWKPIPDDWELDPCDNSAWFSQYYNMDDGSMAQQQQPQENGFSTFTHPATGKQYSVCTTEMGLELKLYFNEDTGQWERFPLSWEAMSPEITSCLRYMDEALPQWQNMSEQLMALRNHNYDVLATIAWKQAEISAGGSEASISLTDSVIIASLEKAVHVKTKKLSELQEEHQGTLARLENLESDNALLKRKGVEHEQLIARQAKRIEELEETAQATPGAPREELQEYSEKIQALTEQLTVLTSEGSADMQEALALKDAELTRVREEGSKAKHERDALRHGYKNILSKLDFTVTNLKEENTHLKTEAVETFRILGELVGKFSGKMGTLTTMLLSAVGEKDDLLAKYKKESLQRKLLYNKIQEMRGNIRVFCRCRFDDRVSCSLKFASESEIVCPTGQGHKSFEYDRVYPPTTTQELVYEDTSPIITSCIDGYNVCFLAYGQTGSGKTYTMMGTEGNPGVNRRAVRELFDICSSRTDYVYKIKISLMEIYNEHIYDLLRGNDTPEALKVRTNEKSGRVYVEHLEVRDVSSVQQVTDTLDEGDKNRSVAATAMNAHSSRSHLLLQITVEGQNLVSNVESLGKLTLVDLAGSERVSKSEAAGQRLVEAAAINKSLSSLGLVFSSLASGQKHIPYRNSKLTHVLQDSLGGDSKTCMFINVSPAESNLSETLSTLQFGQGIAKIELGPVKKNNAKKKPRKKK